MAEQDIRALLVRADSICSLIYYRERTGLSAQTQEDLKALCRDLRVATDPRNSDG